MNKIIILAALMSAGFLSGCVSMSSLQTARTLKDGESRQTFGGGVFNSKSKIGTLEFESNLPYVEYSYRRGFGENFDAGLKLTLIGAYAADAKYQVYAAEKFAMSVGAGLGYMSYETKSGDVESKVNYIDVILPVYFSYDFTPGFSLYAAPKYVHRSASGDATGSDSIVGAAVGTKIGEKSGVFIEAAMVKGKDENSITQYNISYFW